MKITFKKNTGGKCLTLFRKHRSISIMKNHKFKMSYHKYNTVTIIVIGIIFISIDKNFWRQTDGNNGNTRFRY